MDKRIYSDFDLVIEKTGDRYRASVINSPAGQASVEFDSLFSPLELENFVLRMGRPQRGMRRIDSTEMVAIRSFGTRLFRTVFNDGVYACYLRSIDNVQNQNMGLRIRLRINVPEFHDLPWEYLYNPQFDQFLALSKDTPIIRYIELPYTTLALPVKTPMKILVMISSPEGFPPLDIEEEWKRLNLALQPLIDRDLVVLERLEKATLSALQQQLRRDEVHIFHFIGHGKYFEHQQEGMLLLEDDNHRGRPTSGQHLGAILHDHHTLRLVVLNACEGARTSAEDPYTGVAQTLVRQGIPAVLAMQFEIFESAAITLAQEFYSAIADGYPVDAALSEARKAIFAANNDVEWGTPVLFMRIPNGILFRPETPAEKNRRLKAERLDAEKAAREKEKREAEEKKKQEQRLSSLNRLYEQLKIQLDQGDWSAAMAFLEQIDGLEPGFRDTVDLRKQVETEQERAEKVANFLSQGKLLVQEGDWSGAVRILQQLLDLVPGHAEATSLLAHVQAKTQQEQELREQEAKKQRQAQLASLYEQASAKTGEKDWGGSIKMFEEIERIEAGYRDVKILLSHCRAQAERQKKFTALVVQGKEFLETKREWLRAITIFQQALALDAENLEVRALLAEAEKGERIQGLLDAAQKALLTEQWTEALAKFQAVLEYEPEHPEARRQLAETKIKLDWEAKKEQKKPGPLPEGSGSGSMKPTSLPEEIKVPKQTSPPEEIKPNKKPGDLPR